MRPSLSHLPPPSSLPPPAWPPRRAASWHGEQRGRGRRRRPSLPDAAEDRAELLHLHPTGSLAAVRRPSPHCSLDERGDGHGHARGRAPSFPTAFSSRLRRPDYFACRAQRSSWRRRRASSTSSSSAFFLAPGRQNRVHTLLRRAFPIASNHLLPNPSRPRLPHYPRPPAPSPTSSH